MLFCDAFWNAMIGVDCYLCYGSVNLLLFGWAIFYIVICLSLLETASCVKKQGRCWNMGLFVADKPLKSRFVLEKPSFLCYCF